MNDRQSLPKPLRRRGCPAYPYKLFSKCFLYISCWATPPGSIDVRVFTTPASLASQADTGLWKGEASGFIIRRQGFPYILRQVSMCRKVE